MTTFRLPLESADTFADWLTPKRMLAAAATKTQLAITDDTDTWIVPLSDSSAVRTATRCLSESNRKVWAYRSGPLAVRIARAHDVPLSELEWLYCASTAEALVLPNDRADSISDLGRRPSAAKAAAMTLDRLKRVLRGALKEVRKAVLASCKQERLWRPRQLAGWRVDVEMLHQELAAREPALAQAKLELGVDLADDSSDENAARIHAWLAEEGITITDRKGMPSLDRDDYDHAEIPDRLESRARWREFRRVRSTASRVTKLHEIRRALRDDRIYSEVIIHRARTGRGAVVRPALQNIARELRPLLKADDGYTLVALDYGQVEPRVAAALSEDTAMKADLDSGDVYAALARKIWNEYSNSDEPVDPDHRDKAKTGLLAVLYGQGVSAFAAKLSISVDRAQALIEGIWGAYPQLREFKNAVERADLERNPGLTHAGRPVSLSPRGKYQALNGRVQSEAADLLYAGARRTLGVLGADAAFLAVHDELVVMVPDADSERAVRILNATMPSSFRGIEVAGDAANLGTSWRKI